MLSCESLHEVAERVSEEIVGFGEACVPVLKRLLDDNDRGIGNEQRRLLAVSVIGALAQRPGNSWTRALLLRLIELVREDWDRSLQTQAVRAIGTFGESASDAIPVLESWCESANEFQHLTAAEALLKVAPGHPWKPKLLGMLLDGVRSENSSVAAYATCCLTDLGPRAEPVLESLWALHAGESRLTQCYSGAAIHGISGALDPYLDGLVSLLESETVSHRRLAAVKLAGLGSEARPAVGLLQKTLATIPAADAGEEHKQLRQSVEEAIQSINRVTSAG